MVPDREEEVVALEEVGERGADRVGVQEEQVRVRGEAGSAEAEPALVQVLVLGAEDSAAGVARVAGLERGEGERELAELAPAERDSQGNG